jgi:L-rhamnose mutarotase
MGRLIRHKKFVMRIVYFILLLTSLSVALVACKNGQEAPGAVRRYGMVTGIRPDKIERYRQLHAAIWPDVLKKIKECNIRNYSIYLQKIDNSYFLFSYFEYTGTDFDGDMRKMAADSITRRWWAETDPTQLPLPEAAAEKKIWTNMKELFHTD